jgi:hypothetical protein
MERNTYMFPSVNTQQRLVLTNNRILVLSVIVSTVHKTLTVERDRDS